MEQHVHVNESEYKNLMISINHELSNVFESSSVCSIYKVPTRLRNVNAEAYDPHLVSIGPIHYQKEDPQLKAMESHKWQYMNSLICRLNTQVEECGAIILSLMPQIRHSYAQQIDFDNCELAKLILRDGCFVIELFLRYSSMDDSVEMNDPIFNNAWMIQTLQRDLVLLENQIPFFVLDYLFKLTVGKWYNNPTHALSYFALFFFKSALNLSKEAFKDGNEHTKHLLDLLRSCLVPLATKTDTSSKLGCEFIRCAARLRENGIIFERETTTTTNNLLDIKFIKGVFKIPTLHIHDSTDSILRNLIAYEQCCIGCSQYITSYAFLMDRLIDSPDDVEILEHEKILENHLGVNEEVSTLFNSICDQVVLNDFYFAGLCAQVSSYYRISWYRYKAALKRDYFKNPWTIISFVAAVFLLLFTALQTLYSVLGYHLH